VTGDFLRGMERSRPTPEAEFSYQVLVKTEPYISTGRSFFWDQPAAALLTDESLATYQTRRLSVVDIDGPDHGRTVDVAEGADIRVATRVDRLRFESLFLGVLCGWPTGE